MKKIEFVLFCFVLAVIFVAGCQKHSPAPLIVEEPPPAPVVEVESRPVVEETASTEIPMLIDYVVIGKKDRVDRVADFMEDPEIGYATVERKGGPDDLPEGEIVILKRKSSPEGAGIHIPVSDDAVANGLCIEQSKLIASQSIAELRTVEVAEVPETSNVQCEENSFAVSGGLWAKLRDADYIEFKISGSNVHKAVRWEKSGRTVNSTCRVEKNGPDNPYLEVPSSLLDPGETVEEVLRWDLPKGDGGVIKTYRIFLVHPPEVAAN